MAIWKKRLTGADLDTNRRWHVAGTDLGIPYVLENLSIGYLFGDTFNTPGANTPPLPNDWRAPDRKSTRLNSSHLVISYAVFCLKKKKAQLFSTGLLDV